MTHDARMTLRLALLWLRLALGGYVLYWGLMLILVAPATSLLPFADRMANAPSLGYAIAVVGVLAMLGIWRTLSYGLVLFLQGMSTFASYEAILAPLSADAGRAFSSLPLLGAAVLLFVLRDQDALLSSDLGFVRLGRIIARLQDPDVAEPAAQPAASGQDARDKASSQHTTIPGGRDVALPNAREAP